MNKETKNKVFRIKTKSKVFEGVLLKADSEELVFGTKKGIEAILRVDLIKISKLKTDPRSICENYEELLENYNGWIIIQIILFKYEDKNARNYKRKQFRRIQSLSFIYKWIGRNN